MIIYYLNHVGEKLDLDSDKIILQYQELFNYSWDAETSSGKIKRFYRENSTFPVTVGVAADNEEEYLSILHTFFSITEKDVITNNPGKLYIGDQYLKCFISGSIKEDAFMGVPFQKKNLTITTDYPFWCRDRIFHFYASEEEILDAGKREEIGSILDHTEVTPDYLYDYKYGFYTDYGPAKKRALYDYKYDYYHNHTVGKLDNDHFTGSGFRMIVYGPCTWPNIGIGGNVYRVSTTLYEDEYMVIDSRNRTVTRYARNGVEENLFHSRDRENNVFEKIPPGKSTVRWNAQYSFDVVLFQERSEPTWSL